MKKMSVAGLFLTLHAPLAAHESGSSTMMHALEHGVNANVVVYCVGIIFFVTAVVAAVRFRARP